MRMPAIVAAVRDLERFRHRGVQAGQVGEVTAVGSGNRLDPALRAVIEHVDVPILKRSDSLKIGHDQLLYVATSYSELSANATAPQNFSIPGCVPPA